MAYMDFFFFVASHTRTPNNRRKVFKHFDVVPFSHLCPRPPARPPVTEAISPQRSDATTLFTLYFLREELRCVTPSTRWIGSPIQIEQITYMAHATCTFSQIASIGWATRDTDTHTHTHTRLTYVHAQVD